MQPSDNSYTVYIVFYNVLAHLSFILLRHFVLIFSFLTDYGYLYGRRDIIVSTIYGINKQESYQTSIIVLKYLVQMLFFNEQQNKYLAPCHCMLL